MLVVYYLSWIMEGRWCPSNSESVSNPLQFGLDLVACLFALVTIIIPDPDSAGVPP